MTSAANRATREVDQRYRHSPYGETTVLESEFKPKTDDSITLDNEYTYTGRWLDPSGLMYFRARYYHPGTGEFISRDPLGYVDGMSQYRAYFAPGGLDPLGKEKIRCRCRAGWETGSTFNYFFGSGFYRTHTVTVECGGKTPGTCCKKECAANKDRGPNNIDLCYVGFEYVEPVSVNLQFYIWPGSQIKPPSIRQNVLGANKILSPAAVVLNAESIEFTGRQEPPTNLAYNQGHPVHQFIENNPTEIQVHITRTVGANGTVGHGFRHNGAVLLADSAFGRGGQTLAHEVGHYLGLEHEGHGHGYLMQEGDNLGKRLTQQDIITLRERAIEVNRRQQNEEPSPFIYDVHELDGPQLRGR